MPSERRTLRRAILPGVRATFEGATGQRQQADVPNLGQGGLFLQTDSPLPIGKRLSLEVHVIGQAAPWAALGRVVWARWLAGDEGPAGMGVKLIDVEDDVSAAIGKLVERLSPLQPPIVIPDAPPSRPSVPGAGSLPPPSSMLVAPLVQPRRAPALQRPPTMAQLAEPNLTIDLVTKKPESTPRLPRPEPTEDWDDEAFLRPKRRRGRWMLLALVLAAAGVGYLYRDRLVMQWVRFRTLAKLARVADDRPLET
jgi:uncharacterized protein (TIGR02266 family)